MGVKRPSRELLQQKESDPGMGQLRRLYTHVFVTETGERYLRSGICNDEAKQENNQQIFQNPCLRLDS